MTKKKKYSAIVIILAILIALGVIMFVWNWKGKRVSNPAPLNNISQAQAQTYSAKQAPTLEKDDLFFGSKQAPVKIFVYEDYSDLYSARLADTLDKLRSDFGDQVMIIVRPYIAKNSPLSVAAAQAVLCAGDRDKWTNMRAILFAQAKNSALSLDNFSSYASQIGLDVDTFKTCLTNPQKSEKIEKLAKTATNYQVLGAPTMFVGSSVILGARPYDNYTDSNGDQVEGLKNIVARLANGE